MPKLAPWNKDVKGTYIRHSEDVHDINYLAISHDFSKIGLHLHIKYRRDKFIYLYALWMVSKNVLL